MSDLTLRETAKHPNWKIMIRNTLMTAVVTMGLCATVAADNIGKPLPAVELEGLSQCEASTFEELAGQAVLLEFFAYW